ncbi:MAG: methyltransferase domain-containing protein [Verrucomicrobia bacterium]|nr:methyltransferase domain-containing protein [Verrucomicrobiota bacterium]MBV8274552.1 methyltransferase domain-containing protein [Verrucomicrobiota bacterium]
MDLLRITRKFDPDVLELMDRPDPSTPELARALINLQKLNRHFGSHRIICHFLNRWLRPGETVKILDACTGFGDIPRLAVELARRRGSRVKLLAVDMQPATLEIARQRSALFPEISYVQADIRSFEPRDRFDIVLCSLALHHFAWREAVEILQRLSRLSGSAVLISDLVRSVTGILGVYLLTSTVFRNPMTKFDGRLSIRRAFSFAEMKNLALEAGWEGFGHRRFLVSHQALWLENSS